MFAPVLMEPRRMRLNSLDTWRCLVIFLMMLDHVRDFFNRGALTSTPTEAGHTTVLLYLTRWIIPGGADPARHRRAQHCRNLGCTGNNRASGKDSTFARPTNGFAITLFRGHGPGTLD